MKTCFSILALILLPLFAEAGAPDLVKLRELYYKASADRTEAESFLKATGNSAGIDKNLLKGYAGMAWMIKANHSFNPYNKLSYFIKGKNLLEEAIRANPQNVELRFLRYCVQTNAPGFLGYSSSVSADKTVILQVFPELEDTDLKKRISEYMRTSSACNATEKKVFQ